MGDRAHIVIEGYGSKIWLYTHWKGSDIAAITKKALKRKQRWNDEGYLARIIFCEMLAFGNDPGALTGETGFGIASRPMEDTSRDIVVNTNDQTVTLPGKTPVAFKAFAGVSNDR